MRRQTEKKLGSLLLLWMREVISLPLRMQI